MSSFDTCTLETCSIDRSIFHYLPSLAANATFIALFGIAFVLHLFQGLRWRSWVFMTCILCGCAIEMAGYGGRIIMHSNPFSFGGFMLQIVCITFAPVFFSAAVYVTLYKIIMYLSPTSSRFTPKLYYILFIPCDIISLVLQAIGGAMSTNSQGSSQTGVNIALAGLCFQVFTLCVFILLSLDYTMRYRKDVKAGRVQSSHVERKFNVFVAFLTLAIICILIRCTYRIDELSAGYSGPSIHNQGEFIGLEGVMIVIAVFALSVAHPGWVFKPSARKASRDGIESPPVESKY